MKVQDVKNIIMQVFGANEYVVSYDDGRGDDSPPEFTIQSKQKPYKEGYKFCVKVGISLYGNGEIWDTNINDIFMAQTTDNKDVLAHILRDYREYTLAPCPEQRLYEIEGIEGAACYY